MSSKNTNNNNINSLNESKNNFENKKTIDDEILNTEINENNNIINNENYKLNQIKNIINNNLNNSTNYNLNKNITNSSFSKKSQNTKTNTSNLKSNDSKNNFYQNLEDKDLYVLKTFQTVKILLISLIISIFYSLLFSFLLLFYNENSFPSNCKNLKRMNRATYIILFISTLFSIICTIIHIKYRLDYEYSKKILQIRSIYNYVITLSFLISLTIIFFIIIKKFIFNCKESNLIII